MTAAAPHRVGQPGRPGTRDALLDAVDQIVDEQGWATCSLQAVARRAGLTTGAIYSTFGSRGALLVAATLRRSPSITTLPEQLTDMGSAVTWFAQQFFALGDGHDGMNLVRAQLELFHAGSRDPSLMESAREPYRRILGGLASELQARAPKGLPAPAMELAHRLVAVLQGLTLQRLTMGDTISEQMFVAAALNAVGLTAN